MNYSSLFSLLAFTLTGCVVDASTLAGRMAVVEALARHGAALARLRAAAVASPHLLGATDLDVLAGLSDRVGKCIESVFRPALDAAGEHPTEVSPAAVERVLLAFVSLELEAAEKDGSGPPSPVTLEALRALALDLPGLVAARANDDGALDAARRAPLS